MKTHETAAGAAGEPKRGGARAGAGRKPIGNEAKVSLALDAHAIDVFIKLGDGNMSLGARLCAQAHTASTSSLPTRTRYVPEEVIPSRGPTQRAQALPPRTRRIV